MIKTMGLTQRIDELAADVKWRKTQLKKQEEMLVLLRRMREKQETSEC